MSDEVRIRDAVRRLVRELAAMEGMDEVIPDDEGLLEGGFLQSLQMLELVLGIGDAFGVEVAPGDVFEGHFASIDAIVAFVAARGGHV